MAHYNMLADVVEDSRLTAWRFRVKILRIHSFNIDPHGQYWSYILADEAGSKIEMTIYPANANRFRRLENHEGYWIEVFRVEVDRVLVGFKPGNPRFRLSAMKETEIKIINPLNNRHYMEFKRIHQINYIRNRDFPIDIMGVVFNTKFCFENSTTPKMEFWIRDNIDNKIKCVANGNHAYAFRNGFEEIRRRGQVVVVLKMWKICRKIDIHFDEIWLETEGGYSDFRFNPDIPEVMDFKEELLSSDHYKAKYGSRIVM